MFLWLASAIYVYVCAHVCVEPRGRLLCPSFYVGAEDPKLDPHVCVTSISLTEPSPHAPKHGILRINSVECDGSCLLS